jgi:aspartyl-tRNA(Asn)/glutamyl-tRNA(Gln) amidotransferase subunit C
MPDTFTAAEILRIAELARIDLTADEQAMYARQLSEILAFARQVQGIDTHDVPPTSHPTGVTGLLRDDVVSGSLPREEILAQAPEADRAAGLFKVPRVLG